MHGHTSIRKFNKRPDKNIYKIFWNIRYTQCCLGREKVGPLRTSLASHSHLPLCRNQRYNLWSWTYLLRKNLKNKSLLELTVCLFNISFQRGYIDILFLLLSRIKFRTAPSWIKLAANSCRVTRLPCLPGRSHLKCRMYKKHVFSYPVERSKHKFGETSSAFAGCHCVYVIEDCSSDHNTPMKHVWILHDIYVLKIRLLCSSAIKRSSEDGITSAAIENGVF